MCSAQTYKSIRNAYNNDIIQNIYYRLSIDNSVYRTHVCCTPYRCIIDHSPLHITIVGGDIFNSLYYKSQSIEQCSHVISD